MRSKNTRCHFTIPGALGSATVLATLCAGLSFGQVAPAQPLFVYRGGPVLSSFTIYPLYYGNWPDAAVRNAHDSYLKSLARYISGLDSGAGQKPVIWQYGVTSATVASSFTSKRPSISPVRKITRDDIPKIIHANQESVDGKVPLLPPYGPNTLIVVFVSSDYGLDCGSSCGAYHSDEPPTATSSTGYYAAVPATDQYYTSHEIFESATDPFVSGTDCGLPSGSPGDCSAAPGWQRSAGVAKWDELADNCPYAGLPLSFGKIAQIMDNTRNGVCAPTAYITPATTLTGTARFPHAYHRSDDVHSVVFDGMDSYLYGLDLPLGGSWTARGISSLMMVAPPAASGHPVPFVQAIGENSLVYRGYDNQIYLVHGTGFTSWAYINLSQKAGAPQAAGDPTAYRRFDNVNSIVYRGTDGHIHEIYAWGSGWSTGDLSAITGATSAAGDTAAYIRSDGVSAVVYRSTDNHICELALTTAGSWQWGDLAAQHNAPLAAGEPAPYVRNNNVNSVVYRGADSHIYSLDLVNGSWTPTDFFAAVTPAGPGLGGSGGKVPGGGIQLAAGDPAAYRRFDGVDAVVYRGTNQRIFEFSWSANAWHLTDLTQASGAPATAIAGPNGYRRFDNVNSVVFESSDHHIREIYRLASQTTWQSGDLTGSTGAMSAK